jgi:hypothetical protein
MASVALRFESRSILRFSAWDTLFVALAGVHGAVLLMLPAAPVIAAGLWWNANTISHNFIHRPFFRPGILNRLFSAYLSVLLGFPQTLWRDRHLAHHSGAPAKLRISSPLVMETLLVGALWITLGALRPRFFLIAYLPGWVLGLALCALQGRYEHARGGVNQYKAVSHYGRLYNWLCFNDGYHAEHHGHPGMHWTRLPEHVAQSSATSRWPPLLRWLDDQPNRALEILERLVLRSQLLQRFVIGTHFRACKALLMDLPQVDRVTIVGGALFPRTALILRGLLPRARLVIVDANATNLETARANLPAGDIEWIRRRFDAAEPCDCDLLVIPLSFHGDRARLYRNPPAPAVLVHDWIWRKRGSSCIVSIALLKRVNLIRSCER